MTYSQEQYDALLAVCRSYKQDVERLTEKLKQVLLNVDTVKEMNAMCDIDEQRKRAVQDFAEKLKKYSCCDNDFMDGKWHRYVLVSDIDELLKEYENDT